MLISLAHAVRVSLVGFGIFVFTENEGNFSHMFKHINYIRCGLFGMRADEVGYAERLDVHGFRPFSVRLTVIADHLGVFIRKSRRQTRKRTSADGMNFIERITAQILIVFFQYTFVPVLLENTIANKYRRIRPTRRSVHRVHIFVNAAFGCDLTIATVLSLPVIHVADVFTSHCRIIYKITCRINKDLRITRPTVTFSRRTIGGHVRVVVFGRPTRAFHQFVDEFVRTVERKRLAHIRVYGDCGKVFGAPRHIRFHQNVLKTEDGKSRFIFVDAVFRRIDHLLQWSNFGAFFVSALYVFLCKLTLFIEHFTKAKFDGLSRFCVDAERYKSRDVLPEIQNGFTRGRFDNGGSKPLVFGNGYVVGRGGHNGARRHFCFA